MRTSGADAMIGRAQITAPLNQFMRWWVDELIGCIPAAWREIPNRRSQILDVIVSPDEMTFHRRKAGNDTELGRVSLVGESASAVRAQLGKMRRQINVRRATIVLKLTPEQALRHRIVLPLAVAENLREALTYELDRHTPFRAEDVYFDYQVRSTDRQAQRISVDIIVVPRAMVDRAVSLMKEWGMTPDRIDVAGSGGDDRIDLHASAARGPHGRFTRYLSRSLAALAIALAGTAVYLEFRKQQETLSVYQEALEQRQRESRNAEAANSQLADLLNRSQYIVQRKQDRPLVAALFDEVTKRIPDDIWFTQFHLQADKMVVSGYAPSASALIALLEDSPMLSQVRFMSPVTLDPKRALERFNLSASIEASGATP